MLSIRLTDASPTVQLVTLPGKDHDPRAAQLVDSPSWRRWRQSQEYGPYTTVYNRFNR